MGPNSQGACGTGGRACEPCPNQSSCDESGHCVLPDGGIISFDDAGADAGPDGGTGSPDGGPGSPDGGGSPFDQWCANLVATFCNEFIGCHLVDPSAFGDCVSFETRNVCWIFSSDVAHGFWTFDANAAAGCLAGAQALTDCVQIEDAYYYGGWSGCNWPLSPNAAPGQACSTDYDCAGTSPQGCYGSGCARTCQPAGAVGQPCEFVSCGSSGWCDVAADLCRAPLPAGSPCSFAQFVDPCDVTSYCDSNQGICVLLPGNGSPCLTTGFGPCAPGTWCDYSVTPSLCRSDIAVGGNCSTGQCVATAYCNASQAPATCMARQPSGTACSIGNEQCVDGLVCNFGICQPPPGLGQLCDEKMGGNCQGALVCDPILLTCGYSTIVSAGSTCTGYNTYCPSGTACIGTIANADGGVGQTGTCQVPTLGNPCNPLFNGNDCPIHTTCQTDGGTSQGQCVTSALGSNCGASRNCLQGQFCDYYAAKPGCALQGASGQTCEPYSDSCQSPYTCIAFDGGASGVCGLPGGAGAPCDPSSTFNCQFPYACLGGFCVSAGHAGEPCLDNGIAFGACLSGDCLTNDAGPYGTCAGPGQAGQVCGDNLDCGSLICGPEGVGFGPTCQASCP